MTYLAIINTITNICENVTVDFRNAEDVVLPSPYIAVDLATTYAIHWHKDDITGEWVQGDPSLGTGGIGMIWDGEKLIQPQPQV